MKRTWVKCICAILCALCWVAGILGAIFAVSFYVDAANGENFYENRLSWRVTDENMTLVYQGIGIWANKGDGNLTVYATQQLEEISRKLGAQNSNFRFECTLSDGTVALSNVANDPAWRESVYRVHVNETNTFVSGRGYNGIRTVTIAYGVAAPLQVEDGYWEAQELYDWLLDYQVELIALCVGILAAALLLLILLLIFAGRRVGRDEVVLNLQDRVPYDLYLVVIALLAALCGGLALYEGIYYFELYENLGGLLWIAGAILGLVILAMALLLTTATRIKARTLLRNTVIWRLCRLLWRLCRRLWGVLKRGCSALGHAFHMLPMAPRAVGVFALYLLAQLLLLLLLFWGVIHSGWAAGMAAVIVAILLTLVLQLGALFLICCWVLQWRKIRESTEAIVAGKTDAKIESERFYPDLKEHAQQLNDLGGAIDNAVDQRLKSERFKTELITNVSHDLKTPLTSIINYVDLMKKEDIPNPTVQEYIEVLDRKSQRLKKLTEDLVEASKASAGTLSVTRERLDAVQLIRQATGEYEEKLAAAGLTLVTKLPEEPVTIHADGRHVWRVLDNLLGNCAKYALEGTRVYLDAASLHGLAVITVKNVSRNPLDVPAEQLMERFVRGDEARATEGSGLGLSIARSLVELQGGQFALDIDGDLFKAKITMPLAQ